MNVYEREAFLVQSMSELQRSKLIAVHLCRKCGAVVRRDQWGGAPTSSGIFRCLVCGSEGGLNVQIRSEQDAPASV